jgi:hypothetical protein
MNSTKCKISQPVHVWTDLSQAENTRIAQNVKSPNMHTSQNIFLQLKIHVHDRSRAKLHELVHSVNSYIVSYIIVPRLTNHPRCLHQYTENI